MSVILNKNTPARNVAIAVAMALGSTAALAQQVQEAEMQEIIVTGTRKTGMVVTDSPAPVQLVNAEALTKSAAPDLMNALATQVPSFNATQVGGDMASQTLTAALRNLSPNHTLVLINGKRLHSTSNINPNTGSAAADLSFLPSSAIARVEVLTDGAAALYGSDAIAGVVNIILKEGRGSELSGGYAGYQDGGGATQSYSASVGFGDEAAFLNLSAEYEDRKSVYRFGPTAMGNCFNNYANCLAVNPDAATWFGADPGGTINGGSKLNAKFPYLNNWLNPPEMNRRNVYFNAGMDLVDGISFYAFGGIGRKEAASEENYRSPIQDGGYTDPITGAVSHKYPYGFNPSEASHEIDYSLTAGFTGKTADWHWDASSSYGRDVMDVYTINSMNFTLWQETGSSPEDFYDGTYWADQWTTNFNATREFDVGLAAPLTFNAGVEYRLDRYGIKPGEPTSYYGAGASSFPGYNPLFNTGSYDRHSTAVFADAVFNPLEKWVVDVAARYEDYSDFGSKAIGKLTTRYDVNDAVAVRATASTGFRAPTLGEGFYSAIQVGPNSASPTLQPNSPAATALGFGAGLKPETSVNLSAGIVLTPLPNLTSTIDLYRITIKDRINSATFYYSTGGGPADPYTGADALTYNTALGQALVNFGYLGAINPAAPGGALDSTARNNISVTILNNALKTRASGLDWVTNYHTGFDWGSIDWNLAANYNKLEVIGVKNAPAVLGGKPMYSTQSIINMEKNSPKFRVNLGATLALGKFSLNVTEAVYGPQYRWNRTSTNNEGFRGGEFPASLISKLETTTLDGALYYKQKISTLALTNVTLKYAATSNLTFTVGGDNVFNKYPSKVPQAVRDYVTSNYENQWGYLTPYLTDSPIGFFGAKFFGKVSYTF